MTYTSKNATKKSAGLVTEVNTDSKPHIHKNQYSTGHLGYQEMQTGHLGYQEMQPSLDNIFSIPYNIGKSIGKIK